MNIPRRRRLPYRPRAQTFWINLPRVDRARVGRDTNARLDEYRRLLALIPPPIVTRVEDKP